MKKHFTLFCLLTDSEMATLSKKYTQEKLELFLSTKIDAAITRECEEIEMDEEFESIREPKEAV